MVLEHNVTLSNETVVMYALTHVPYHLPVVTLASRVWISSEHAASIASKNFRLVHGPSDYFYLVCT